MYRRLLLSPTWDSYSFEDGQLFGAARYLGAADAREVWAIDQAFRCNERTFRERKWKREVLYRQDDATFNGARKLIGDHKIDTRIGERLQWKLVIDANCDLDVKLRLNFYAAERGSGGEVEGALRQRSPLPCLIPNRRTSSSEMRPRRSIPGRPSAWPRR